MNIGNILQSSSLYYTPIHDIEHDIVSGDELVHHIFTASIMISGHWEQSRETCEWPAHYIQSWMEYPWQLSIKLIDCLPFKFAANDKCRNICAICQ